MADDAKNITNEELENALAGANELAAELGGLSSEQSIEEVNDSIEEIKAGDNVNEVSDINIGDNVRIKDSVAGIFPNINENDNLRIIEHDGQMATIVKEGEETTPILIQYDMLEKADVKESGFDFSEIVEIPQQENTSFNFDNVQQQNISESLPLEYNEYQPGNVETVAMSEETIEPAVVEPVVMEEETIEPAVVEPVVMEEETIEPAEVEPVVMEEETIEQVTVEPVVMEEETIEDDYDDDKGYAADEEVIAEEKGSKPIRWSTNFIDKIRDKRKKFNAERTQRAIEKEKKYAEEILEKDNQKALKEAEKAEKAKEKEAEKAEKAKEKEAETKEKKAAIKGNLVKFKSILGKPMKLFKKPEIGITKMFDKINSKIAEQTKANKLKKEEAKKAKEIKKQEKEKNKKENESIEPVVSEEEFVEEENFDNNSELSGGSILYEEFLKLPEEIKEESFNMFYESIAFLQKENEIARAKLAEAEAKLEEANRVISEQNNKIEEIVKANGNIEVTENAAEAVEKNNLDNESIENNNDDSKEKAEPIEINPDVPTLNDTTTEPVRSRIDWDDPIVKAELEATKKSGEIAKAIEESKKKPFESKEDFKKALKEGKVSLKVKEEVSNFTDEERKNDEIGRYTYDREKQAEVEAFWQNQAAYIDNPEYIEAARERATEAIEMQNMLREPERKKREEFIAATNKAAKLNRIRANLILDNYDNEQLDQMVEMAQEESKGRKR